MKKKYRIVSDNYNGYECQIKYPFLPFWFQLSINTHPHILEALSFIKSYDDLKKRRKHEVYFEGYAEDVLKATPNL